MDYVCLYFGTYSNIPNPQNTQADYLWYFADFQSNQNQSFPISL